MVLPVKQGLKPVTLPGGKWGSGTVEVVLPVKQGLKRHPWPYLAALLAVEVVLPVKQGLKLLLFQHR